MMPVPTRIGNRRDVLQILVGATAAVSLPSWVFAQRRHEPIVASRLTDTLLLISGAGGNVVLCLAGDAALMVNGGLPERSVDLLKVVAAHSNGKRVRTVFNTDWHPSHTGANEALGRAGATIVAHEHTKQYLGADLFVDWENRTYKARPAPALPTETFYTTGATMRGDERIEYGHLGQAHTDGDIYVYFRTSNVLVAGDAMSVGAYPIADYTTGGWLGGLMTATKTLLDLTSPETQIVPGVGPIQTRADLQAQYEMLAAMRDRLVRMMRQGMSARDMLAAGATKEFDAKWGDPTLFVSTTYRGLWLHVRELGGIV
jgi:glyoxylase-like metal-dependent hydrolase (beta-lactamase superfamily II)